MNHFKHFGVAASFIFLLGSVGCSNEIGDSCSTNVDCSVTGDRICVLLNSGGYCTVEGCDISSCPDEATCIRFFSSTYLTIPCNPVTEDAADLSLKPAKACTAEDKDLSQCCTDSDKLNNKCQTNDCTSDETCLTSGFCALRTQERRFCMKTCEDNADCRDDQECRSTGTRGAEAVPNPDAPGFYQTKFCAPKI